MSVGSIEIRARLPSRVSLFAAALLGQSAFPALADTEVPEHAATFYVAQISSERTWQHVVKDPFGAEYTNAYLFTAALSRSYAHRWNGALRLELEGNVTYNFGDQHHWEFNAVPIVARWERFPWDRVLATTAAFGVGLSYATEVPEVEVELEGQSQKWLLFWALELTAGPRDAPWSVLLRLHHRSDGWGLMGQDGGMNAIGAGVRYQFR